MPRHQATEMGEPEKGFCVMFGWAPEANYCLVGDLEHLDYFSIQLGIQFVIPTDELIFFRRVGIQPTSSPTVH